MRFLGVFEVAEDRCEVRLMWVAVAVSGGTASGEGESFGAGGLRASWTGRLHFETGIGNQRHQLHLLLLQHQSH